MKCDKILLVLLITKVIVLNSCSNTFPKGKKAKKDETKHYRLLNILQYEVKKEWLNTIDNNFESLSKHKIELNKYEFDTVGLKPVLIYFIDSVHFYNVNSKTDLANSLQLEKSKSIYYVAINNAIKVCIFPKIENNKVSNDRGYTSIFPELGKKIIELKNQGTSIYMLHVYNKTNKVLRVKEYIFYVNKKGDFLSLNPNGLEERLLENLIMLRKKYVNM
jgi:hypothetical protein